MMPVDWVVTLSGLTPWSGSPPWCVSWPDSMDFCVLHHANLTESLPQTPSVPALANLQVGLRSILPTVFVYQNPYRSPQLSTTV